MHFIRTGRQRGSEELRLLLSLSPALHRAHGMVLIPAPLSRLVAALTERTRCAQSKGPHLLQGVHLPMFAHAEGEDRPRGEEVRQDAGGRIGPPFLRCRTAARRPSHFSAVI